MEDEELHKIREAFNMFDRNGNLTIEITELGDIYRTLGRDFTDEELREMVNNVDLNKDGYITFHEFINMYKKAVHFKIQEEKLMEAFKICDYDGNNYVTFDELKSIMMEVGENLTDNQLKIMVKEVDKDGDNRIDFKEFIKLMKNQNLNT